MVIFQSKFCLLSLASCLALADYRNIGEYMNLVWYVTELGKLAHGPLGLAVGLLGSCLNSWNFGLLFCNLIV